MRHPSWSRTQLSDNESLTIIKRYKSLKASPERCLSLILTSSQFHIDRKACRAFCLTLQPSGKHMWEWNNSDACSPSHRKSTDGMRGAAENVAVSKKDSCVYPSPVYFFWKPLHHISLRIIEAFLWHQVSEMFRKSDSRSVDLKGV